MSNKKTHECNECHKVKPLTEEYFYRAKGNSTGYNHKCKVCLNAQHKKYKAQKVHLGSETLPDDFRFGSYEKTCLREQAQRTGGTVFSIDKAV